MIFVVIISARVIRHRDVSSTTHGERDKFRITVTEHGKRKAIGHKVVPSVLLASSTDVGEEIRRDNFSSTKQDSRASTLTDGEPITPCTLKWMGLLYICSCSYSLSQSEIVVCLSIYCTLYF